MKGKILMKQKKPFSFEGIWFAVKVLLVFIAVQAIAYAFGHFDADTIAFVTLISAAILYIVVFLNLRRKDKNQKNSFAA